MSAQVEYRFAWLVDIMHATGTIKAATMDLPVPGADQGSTLSVIGGEPYRRLVLNDIVIVHQLTDLFSGVDLPSITTIELDNADGVFDPNPGSGANDWRLTRVVIAHADLRNLDSTGAPTPTVTVEFTGIIADMQFKPGIAVMTVTSIDQAILATLIPKVIVDTTGWQFAQGLGKAIPVACGPDCVVRPPNVGVPQLPAVPNDSEGSDFILSHVVAGSTYTVNSVFTDQDPDKPGLERWPDSAYTVMNNTTYPGYVAIRLFDSSELGSPLVEISRSGTGVGNPARWIEEILTSTAFGLSETVNAGSFTTAAADFSAATLNGAIAGALGHDGTQRRALDVLQEILWLRGARLKKNAAGEWEITVDKAPTNTPINLGFADGHYHNIMDVVSYGRTPLTEAIKTLKLKFATHGRRTRGRFEQADYFYQIERGVLGIGQEVTRTSPWLRDGGPANRVIEYWKRVLIEADLQVVVDVNPEARAVQVGDLVSVTIPMHGMSATTMRVLRVTKRLANQELVLVGYNASIFASYTPGPGDSPVVISRDERLRLTGSGANLIPNPDFSQAPSPVEMAAPTGFYLAHRWFTSAAGGGGVWTLFRTRDLLTVGGFYLTISKDNPGGGPFYVSSILFPISDQTREYIASCYASTSTNLQLAVQWFGATGAPISFNSISVSTPVVRTNPADTNPRGWVRHFISVFRPAHDTDPLQNAVVAVLRLQHSGATQNAIDYDAPQFEIATGRNWPTPWKVYQPWAAARFIHSILRDPDTGAEEQSFFWNEIITFSGTATSYSTVLQIPADAQADVTTRVLTTITGTFTRWQVGYLGHLNAWGPKTGGANLGLTAGTVTGFGNFDAIQTPRFSAARSVVVNFVGLTGSVTGAVRVTAHMRRLLPPDS